MEARGYVSRLQVQGHHRAYFVYYGLVCIVENIDATIGSAIKCNKGSIPSSANGLNMNVVF